MYKFTHNLTHHHQAQRATVPTVDAGAVDWSAGAAVLHFY